MDISYVRSEYKTVSEHSSTLTLSLFFLVILYTLLYVPSSFLIAEQMGLELIDTATFLAPIGTILVTLLLAALYWDILSVQNKQVAIMEQQAGWTEAANSPAVIIDSWSPQENDNIMFYLHNKGNSHVEKLELIVDLIIMDNTTGDTVEEYESRTTLTKEDTDGFESKFLPANTSNYIVYQSEIAFERETLGESARFSVPKSLLRDLTDDRDTVLSCEFVLKLKMSAPGGNNEEREFYRFSIGIFEEMNFKELIKEGKWESRPLHVQPEAPSRTVII